MELELRLLESNAEEAEREEFYLIQRSFEVTGQKKNSAASVTYFPPFKRQKKKKKKRRGPVLLLVLEEKGEEYCKEKVSLIHPS